MCFFRPKMTVGWSKHSQRILFSGNSAFFCRAFTQLLRPSLPHFPGNWSVKSHTTPASNSIVLYIPNSQECVRWWWGNKFRKIIDNATRLKLPFVWCRIRNIRTHETICNVADLMFKEMLKYCFYELHKLLVCLTLVKIKIKSFVNTATNTCKLMYIQDRIKIGVQI